MSKIILAVVVFFMIVMAIVLVCIIVFGGALLIFSREPEKAKGKAAEEKAGGLAQAQGVVEQKTI
jgi:hypothetical protein